MTPAAARALAAFAEDHEEAPSPAPGVGLLHPVPVLAIALLAANDHLFKSAWPGVMTGKLSDLAGLAFFPLVLQAGWELVTRRAPSRAALLSCALATGLVFALVNTWAPADAAYRVGLAALQWPFRAVLALLAGGALPALAPVRHVSDAGDLIALPTLALAIAAGWRRSGG